jgi:putative transposase
LFIIYLPERCPPIKRGGNMSKRFKKLTHTIYECKYHFVFCPRYRFRILKGEVGEYVRQQIYGLCRAKDAVEVIELNIQPDHIHLIVSIPPKYSVSNFMGYLKGKLAIRLFERYERLGKRFWGRHLWGRGYCVSTVGLDEDKIRRYVKWQEEKDKEIEQSQMGLFK